MHADTDVWGATCNDGRVDTVGDVTQRIAAELRAARGRENVSVAAVVRATGASRQRLYDIFNGRISPTVDEMVVLCRYFHVDAVQVMAKAVYGS